MGKLWSETEINILVKNYSDHTLPELMEMLPGRTCKQIYMKAFVLRLKKSKAILSKNASHLKEVGKSFRFTKGIQVWNKGLKGVTTGGIETQFKKGNLPHNAKVDGAITQRKDGYLWVRTSLGKWTELHRVIWTQFHGEITKGHNVQFKDKNPLNCHPDNLYTISRKEQMKQNSLHNLPEEIKKVIQLRGVLNREINKDKTDKS